MTTTAMPSNVAAGTVTPKSISQATKPSEKFFPAKALPKKPNRVIATCMAAGKRAGWLVRRVRRYRAFIALGSSVADIQRLCPTAVVKSGIAIRGGTAKHTIKKIQKWI